jgi:hypothetical protein
MRRVTEQNGRDALSVAVAANMLALCFQSCILALGLPLDRVSRFLAPGVNFSRNDSSP